MTSRRPFRLSLLGEEASVTVSVPQNRQNKMRTAAQTAVWTWIILSIGWLAIVAWVAMMEPMDGSVPWIYAMTAVVPPGSLLATGAVLIWAGRTFHSYISSTA